MAGGDGMDTKADGKNLIKKKDDKAADKKDGDVEDADLSEADEKFKAELEAQVEKLKGEDASAHEEALKHMRTAICAATTTMTSVPKPLKFLRPHYDTIKTAYEKMPDSETKKVASDVISLLAMTQEGSRDCLNYRLTGSSEKIDTWGHEYVRHLSGQIAEEWAERKCADPPKPVDDLLTLVKDIIPYDINNSAEADACDLAMECGELGMIEEYVDSKVYDRVCLYLLSCVPYVPEPEDDELKQTCLNIFRKFDQFPQAMQMALKLNDMKVVSELIVQCKDVNTRRQLAFMLARQQIVLDLDELLEDEEDIDDEEIEKLKDYMRNTKLNESFLALARELDIMEAKTPEDIYKSHLDGGNRAAANVDSAKANLASTFVNAFVNAGFGQDKLIISPGDSQRKWIHRQKDEGIMSAAASLGMLLLWDVDGGLQQIDPYLHSLDTQIKSGALLACGILNSGVSDENDPAYALLNDYILNDTLSFRVGAIAGLGMAYAGSAREDVGADIVPALTDSKSNMEVMGVTALALGQIFVGTCDGGITEKIINMLVDRKPEELATSHARFIVLGLGLIFLGRQQAAEVAMEAMVVLPEAFQKFAKTLLDCCAYAGTGNVLKIQGLLHACSEHVDTEGEDATEHDDVFQAFGALGIAMVAMGEGIGTDMALRTYSNLLQYGEPVIRRAVPIGIALLCMSNPRLSVLDTLSKLSHDPDMETACNAILALGLVGAGTNHARIAGMLRTLAQYYGKDPGGEILFMVRIAQGILHAGKGSITLSPFHTERSLMSPVAMSGILATLISALDLKNTLLKSNHSMLYHLSLAMYPRILCTFADDEDLTPINTSVRVGQAVDVVGQAGKPKTITGFITNNTPVLLGHGDRAQLATDEYLSVTPLLEGFVILKKNPEYDN